MPCMDSSDNTFHIYKNNTKLDLHCSQMQALILAICSLNISFSFFSPFFSSAILKENENKQRVKREVNENRKTLHAGFHPANCRAQHNQPDCLQPEVAVCWYLVMNHSFFCFSLCNRESSSNFGMTYSWHAHHHHSCHKGLQK